MDKIDQLNKAKSLLTSALSAALASMPNNKSVQEARTHMKRALNELDNAAKSQGRKQVMNQNQFKNWWGNVMGGTAATAHQPMSAEAQQKSLDQLNGMIKSEQKTINDLENQSGATDSQLLND